VNASVQRVAAEFIGTSALLAIVVGSGHMGETLAQGNAAIALLANSIATGLGLWVLIEIFSPISGAHFNPIVTLAASWHREISARAALMYIVAQIVGALCGVLLVHAMFDLEIAQSGIKLRAGPGQEISESVATCGLMLTILLGRRSRPMLVPAMVGAYIGCAYWFTASTSFANPAVTIARSFTATFAGIRGADVPMFIVAQFAGGLTALFVVSTVFSNRVREHSS
jgi:glycerol uptake facilitator-like aquaporin